MNYWIFTVVLLIYSMFKPIFIAGFLLIMGIASAQYQPMIKLNPPNSDTFLIQRSPQNQIPNALAQRNINQMLIPKGNNGEGFDLYESTIDRMTIAQPDKTQLYTIRNITPKNQLLIIANPSEFNTGNLQIKIPQPFTDTMYIPPFNTQKFNPNARSKK